MAERSRFDQEHGRAGRAWFDDVLALRGRVRAQIAELIGTSADHVALTGSTTDGCNIVLSGLGLGPSDEVVTTDAEHPGLLLPLHVSGAEVRVAEVAARTIQDCHDNRNVIVASQFRVQRDLERSANPGSGDVLQRWTVGRCV